MRIPGHMMDIFLGRYSLLVIVCVLILCGVTSAVITRPTRPWQLNLAIAREEMLAAAGHLRRNGEKGTRLSVILKGASSLALVRAASGYRVGETCWLPTSTVNQ